TLLHVVAFIDDDVRDLADALAEDVGIGLGADFTRGGDQGDEVLLGHVAGLNGYNVLVGFVDAEPDDSADDKDHPDCDCRFLPNLHRLPFDRLRCIFGGLVRQTRPSLDLYAWTEENVSRLSRNGLYLNQACDGAGGTRTSTTTDTSAPSTHHSLLKYPGISRLPF